MKILTKQSQCIIASSLLGTAFLSAGELTLVPEKFVQKVELDATAIPSKSVSITANPEAWNAMKIEKILPSGSIVKKGDTLVWIDTENLDKKIVEVEKARVKQKLELENAEQDLSEMERSTVVQLSNAERKYKRFLEDYDYYQKVQRPAMIEEADFDLFQAKNYLAYSNEELEQLHKMYKADGLTEDTEEIILERAKHKLESTKLNLAKQAKKTAFIKDVQVQRNDQDWEVGATKAKAEFESVKSKAPRALMIKKQDLELARKNDADADKYLVDLKADRALFNFKSPIDGIFYHGDISDGSWDRDLASKVLKTGGDVPSRVTVMSVVPQQTSYVFSAELTEAQKEMLTSGEKGSLRLEKNLWQSFPVNSKILTEYPSLNSQWRVELDFANADTKPKNLYLGTKAKVSFVVTEAADVISVPMNAVTVNPDGTYSVKVKMAQGDPEMVTVTVGRQSADQLEITSGLTAGQVVITP